MNFNPHCNYSDDGVRIETRVTNKQINFFRHIQKLYLHSWWSDQWQYSNSRNTIAVWRIHWYVQVIDRHGCRRYLINLYGHVRKDALHKPSRKY